jgi:hypothetical protein
MLLKNFKFFSQTFDPCVGMADQNMRIGMVARPRRLGLETMSDLTNNKQRRQLCTLVQKREKKEKTQAIDHRRQSNHYLSTCVKPYEREHDYASSEMVDCQIWPLVSVTLASLMARAPPIRWGRNKKPKKRLVKR